MVVHLGNYADYVRHRNSQLQAEAESQRPAAPRNAPAAEKETGSSGGRTPLSKNEQQRRQSWIDDAEEKILALEDEKAEALQEMALADLANDRRIALGQRIAAIETELQQHMADWEQWSLEIEEGI